MRLSRKDFLRMMAATVAVVGGGTLLQAVTGAGSESGSNTAAAGKRWGMALDTVKCSQLPGCDRCSKACHLTHNVPAIPDKKHEVKWLWREESRRVFPFLGGDFAPTSLPASLHLLCNHCKEPSCVKVCPTKATWKRKDGVVMMDYHRCIGCRYCMAACPYGSRSFNYVDPRPCIATINPDFPTRTIGVVEKCNFCEERLAQGQLPACVAACPQGAMLFGDLNDSSSPLRQLLGTRLSLQRQPELGTAPSIFYLF